MPFIKCLQTIKICLENSLKPNNAYTVYSNVIFSVYLNLNLSLKPLAKILEWYCSNSHLEVLPR